MSVRHVLAAPAAAHASVRPLAADAHDLTTGRLVGTAAALLALAGVVIGGLALARSTGRIGNGNGKRGALVALVAGLIGMAVGVVNPAVADGGPGTGNGVLGGALALVLGLIAAVLGRLALTRSRRTGRPPRPPARIRMKEEQGLEEAMTATGTNPPGGTLEGLGRFCFRRRRLVLLIWLIGVIAVAFAGFGYGAAPDNDFSGGDSQSAKAQQLMEKHFPKEQGDRLTLAIKAEKGIDDPAAKQRIEKALADLADSPVTGPVTSPYQDKSLVTEDRRIARTTIPLSDKGVEKSEVKPLVDMVKEASGDSVTLALGGYMAEKAETPPQGPAESVGLLAAAVILFIAFGSLVAMGLPIATALLAIVGGLALMKLVGHLVPAPNFALTFGAMIGLGVGIDYALFIVTRYKDGLGEGDDPESATVKAVATAGHAVLFAGTTVVIALMGLLVMGQRLMTGLAVATSLTVLVTMIAALTLLPAFLGFTGHKINSLRLPRRASRRNQSAGAASRKRRTLAERWAGVVQRRPLVAALAAGGILLMLAAPVLSMRLSQPDASVQPRDRSSYISYEILSEGFGPGYGAPLVFAAEIDPAGADPRPVVEAVRETEGIAYATPPRVSEDGRAVTFLAFPTTGYQDEATTHVVHRLRDDVLPGTPGGDQVLVGGPNAGTVDTADEVGSRLPLMIMVVVAMGMVLLIALVRSVTIALQAAVMNLLSIGAAYGVLVAVVQWGWLGAALGFPAAMPVTTWTPMMMFPILFGLSMDYQVFLISRVREEYERTGDTRAAVATGLARTAKVITAAAAIMIAVFTTSLLGPDVAVKQGGLGMAVAVLIDATIVRMIFVPAVMELCGKANWWMPGPRAPRTTPTAPAGTREDRWITSRTVSSSAGTSCAITGTRPPPADAGPAIGTDVTAHPTAPTTNPANQFGHSTSNRSSGP